MQTKQLGNSELHITPIGFGAWAIGGGGWAFGWGTQDDRESIEAINRALDLGVNWIDTAAIYGLGHSEADFSRDVEKKNWFAIDYREPIAILYYIWKFLRLNLLNPV
ncbi:MAG: aldo/keto reductase [Nostoc sp.]|uniref:aldo/keto reductase n=1 Tax=Nostoc sp. TaxID=1180 RepID=UPI002FF1202F